MAEHGTRRRQRRTLPALTLAGAAALLSFSVSASAATHMLTSSGASTAPTTSTCAPGNTSCSSGWFSLVGASQAAIRITATAGTNTVVLEHRMDSSEGANVSTLYTWTNAAPTTVGYAIAPPVGEIRVRVTAIGGGGTVYAKLEAVSMAGGRLW